MPQFPFSFWRGSFATPQDMYFYDTGSTLWSDVSNWFTDSGHTIAAGRVPIEEDIIHSDSVWTDVAPTLNIMGFYGTCPNGTSLTAGLTIMNLGTLNLSVGFWGGSNVGGAYDAAFSGTAVLSSTWTGSATFADSARNDGTVTANADFNGAYSYNNDYARVEGLARFYSTSYNLNYAYCYTAEFREYSKNQGEVDYEQWLYDTSIQDSTGYCVNYCHFYNSSYNDGSGGGTATEFLDNSYNSGGQIYSVCYFYDYASNLSQVYNHAYFAENSWNASTGEVDYGHFIDYAYNLGLCYGDSDFYNYSYNDGNLNSSASFYNFTYNNTNGQLYGTSYFNNDSFNDGNTQSYTYFYDAAYNNTYGYCNGATTYFANTAYNYGVVSYDGHFSGNADNYSTATIYGNADFYDYSLNNGYVTGNAIFNNDTTNYGTVNGNGTFYDTSDQLGTVNGTTTCSTSGTCP